jgi:hypothetical protein
MTPEEKAKAKKDYFKQYYLAHGNMIRERQHKRYASFREERKVNELPRVGKVC